MDLVTGAKNVVVAMEHCDKHGDTKILKECTLPLTAKGKVTLIVTDMALIRITNKGAVLEEIAAGLTVEEVLKHTEADLILADNIKEFDV